METNNPFNRKYLNKLNELFSQNSYFLKSIKKVNRSKKSKGFTYQYYNQLCVCIIRIRETSKYLEEFKFRKINDCGQAFDFYEFINCISIIEGCIESMFKVFDMDLSSYFKGKRIFKISNRKKTGDLAFFKFIRSATSVHPAETTSHNKQTGHKFEVYPYAIWSGCTFDFFGERPKNTDIELISFNCKTKGAYKRYYLSINEFYCFIDEMLESLAYLVPVVDSLAYSYKEKLCCKTLKYEKQFMKYSDYLKYLRDRLKKKNDDVEFADGGLLIAAHIIDNILITDDFKNYIKKRVVNLRKFMLSDIKVISFDDIFDELSLYDILRNVNEGEYTSEKFHDYLHKEAIAEIETGNEISFKKFLRYEENNTNYSNAEWSVIQLLKFKDIIYINDGFDKAVTYADLYELTLEAIYLHKCNIENCKSS